MAFGTDMQGRNSHEALLGLQDAEIHLLETIRKCITQKAKCDRDYASALTTVLSVTRKQEVSQCHTPICQVWSFVLNEIESLVQLIGHNADKLCSSTLEGLIRIIAEKKALRKAYGDERARLEQNLAQLQNVVAKCQTEYDSRREKVNLNRTKFDELCRKNKSGTKIDDVKEKYVSSESKLHNIHNDYVIALQEANVFQQHYTSVMLPSLLSLQQKKQESLVLQCKEALLEFASLTDYSSADFSRVFVSIHDAVETINPTAEYHDFVLQHRSDPVVCMSLKFSEKLLNGYSSCLLQSNEIMLNNLTFDNVKQKQKLYCDELECILQQIVSKKSAVENLEAEVPETGTQLSEASAHSLRVDQLKHEVLEQQFVEEKVASIIKLLSEPLDMLGSDPPPLALPDMTAEIETSSFGSHNMPVGSAFASVQQSFVQFKTMAKRLTRRPRGSNIPPPSDEDLNSAQQNYITTEIHDEIRTLPDASNAIDVADQSAVRGAGLHASGVTSAQLGYQNRLLDEEEWFHGVLPRDEVQRLLVNDGDFLVRASKNRKTDDTQYVLSVMWSTHKHFIIQECENGWRFEGDIFPTVHELIMHQYTSQQPVTRKSEAVLKQAISRPDWELRNDDIELHQKIGSGQFGEVFKGSFRSTEVAVKTCRETLNDEVKRKFLQEGRILKQYNHPNIVRFIGIAAQRHPVMIVMEYVSGGSLLSFLRKHGSSQSSPVVVKLAVDASAGMTYLEERNCLHRDLAARNCLVDSELSVKISDFGMSREEQEYVVSGGLKQIPIKWTAPEALNYGTYTSACDVWSFGVLLWEIFSFGAQPYPGLTNSQAREKVDEGYRMPPPENTPDGVCQLMMHCWEQDPKKRPTFGEIHSELQRLHQTVQ